MSRLAKSAVLFVAIAGVSSGVAHAATVTSIYSGPAANWTTAAWVNAANNPTPFPNNGNAGNATYDAVLNAGTLTLDQNITIQKCTLNGGAITGSNTLTTNDLLEFAAGTMSGAGITNANGGLSIDGYGIQLDTRTLNNSGSATMTGNAGDEAGLFYMLDGAVINNSGTFDTGWTGAFSNAIDPDGGAATAIYNTGTFTRSVGSGTTTIAVPFNNSHIVTVQSGKLTFTGGGMETGSFQVSTGATLSIGTSPMTFAAGSSLAGPGNTIINGTATITGPAVTYSGGGNLQLLGTLNGTGTFTATGPLEWSGGMMSDAGITATSGGLAIDGYGNLLDTRTLNNSGSATFTGDAGDQSGLVYMLDGAVINNSGTFDTGWTGTFSNSINPDGGAAVAINNTGTFTRSVGSGTTTISVPFNNSHIVTVQSGKLALTGGGMETGSFQVSTGATLTIGSFAMTFAAGSSLAGPGTTIISGTATITGANVTYSGGGNLQLLGTLNGTGTFTATGPVEWSGGTMSDAGITATNGGLAIDGYGILLDTRTLNNGGSATFTGDAGDQGGIVYMLDGAIINNSGTFDTGWTGTFNNSINPDGGAATAINNTGTFTRSVGSGTTTIAVPFYNSHIVTVQSGKLALTGGGTETGSFQAGASGTLTIGGTAMTFAAGSSLAGPGTTIITGTATITGPAVTYSGGGNLQIIGTLNGAGTLTATGPVELTGGTLSGAGVTATNGGLTIDGYQSTLDTRTLNNGGMASFTGDAGSAGGFIYMYNGATINNTGTFDTGWSLNFNNTISFQGGNPVAINNSGTFTRSVGSGTTTISAPFNNSHIVTVQAGTLALNSGGMQTGSFQVAMGATLNFGGTGMTFAAGSSLAGSGTTIISGTATVTGPVVTYSGGGNLQITGTLNGAGTLTATGPVELAGGTMSGGGITATNGGLTIDGYQSTLDTRTLNNGGTASFTGDVGNQNGFLYFYNGATINNSGTFDTGWSLNFNNTFSYQSGNPVAIVNTGTFTRSVGSGTTTVVVPFTNNGTIEAKAGKLEFDSSLAIGNGSILKVSGGTLKINASSTIVGSGATAAISGSGTLELASSVSALGVASPAANRVAISNTSTAAAGLLISGGNQQVGGISGTGTVQINAGTSLTANDINAGALILAGQAGSPAHVTIAVSDVNGQPMDEGMVDAAPQTLLAGSLLADAGNSAFSDAAGLSEIGSPPAASLFGDDASLNVAGTGLTALNTAAVPEPTSILLLATAVAGLSVFGRRRKRVGPRR